MSSVSIIPEHNNEWANKIASHLT